ncbi:MAG: hypothetical protein JHC19_07410 [Desulfurococcaceae archaeon]|nr:hypothetical protein [Desulfurococcaceae archaeon]
MPEIKINISNELYQEILQRYRVEGYKSPEEYVLKIIERALREKPSEEVSRLERKFMDLFNKYSSKVDELGQRMSQLTDEIDDLREKYRSLEERLEEIRKAVEREREEAQKTVVKKPSVEHVEREAPQPVKKTAIEVLKEQKIMFESSISSKIRDRDSFFRRLERDGAKILRLKNERVAVDPDFWREFVNKLSNIHDDNISVVKNMLSKEEYKLFEKLKENDMLIYSAVNKRWEVFEE